MGAGSSNGGMGRPGGQPPQSSGRVPTQYGNYPGATNPGMFGQTPSSNPNMGMFGSMPDAQQMGPFGQVPSSNPMMGMFGGMPGAQNPGMFGQPQTPQMSPQNAMEAQLRAAQPDLRGMLSGNGDMQNQEWDYAYGPPPQQYQPGAAGGFRGTGLGVSRGEYNRGIGALRGRRG